jgi:hypothetical protein
MLIARTGDTVRLPDGSTVTIQALQFAGGSGNEDGRPSGFSDNGQIVYRIIDSGGIFCATIRDAPLASMPAAAWLFIPAVLAAAALRSRSARQHRR